MVTGGTGSFGSVFVKRALSFVDAITVYSRDEFKQGELAVELGSDRVRFVIGDVRDRDRLSRAAEGCDTIIHAAAMKQVPACDTNPTEAVAINVDGSRNVVSVATERKCRAVVLSTDKAALPTTLYGATKLIADRLFLAAGFPVVRCGNIFASRGSVVPLFASQRDTGSVTVTDMRMTRYSITVDGAVDIVAKAMREGGACIYVPKMPSYRIGDVIEAIAPGCAVNEIGARAGERLHECLITDAEASCTHEYTDHYIIDPALVCLGGIARGLYSDQNTRWLTVADIRGAALNPAQRDAEWLNRLSIITSGEM